MSTELIYIGPFPSDEDVATLEDWFSCGLVIAESPLAAAAVREYQEAVLDFITARLRGEASPLRQALVVASLAAAVVKVSDLKAMGLVRHATPEETVTYAPALDILRGKVLDAGLPPTAADVVLRMLGVPA